MQCVVSIICVAVFTCVTTFGQDDKAIPKIDTSLMRLLPRVDVSEDFVVSDVRGNIRATAVKLSKPMFPEAARIKGIEGVVRIQVVIASSGYVENALPMSGDALLAGAAVEAARNSRFRVSSDMLDPNGTLTGVLIYEFRISVVGWSRISSDLLRLATSGPEDATITVILKSIDPTWIGERAVFDRRRAARRSESKVEKRQVPITVNITGVPKGKTFSVTEKVVIPGVCEDCKLIVQELIGMFRTRLANDDLSAWQFELGLELYSAYYLSRTEPTPRNKYMDDRTRAVSMIKRFIDKRSARASDEVIEALKTLEKNFALKEPTLASDRATEDAILSVLRTR